MDCKTRFKHNEVAEILDDPEAEPLLVKCLGATNVFNEWNRIDETHRFPR